MVVADFRSVAHGKINWKDVDLAHSDGEGELTIKSNYNQFVEEMHGYKVNEEMRGFYPMSLADYLESNDPETDCLATSEIEWDGIEEAYQAVMEELSE